MELIKEKISLFEKFARQTFNIVSESDVIVPDTKPDIKKILQINAMAKLTETELQNDRVLVTGKVTYNVIYMSDGEKTELHCIKTTLPFTDVVSLKGVNNAMNGEYECEISNVNFKVINGRKFSVNSTVEVKVEISYKNNVDYIKEIPQADIQSKSQEISYLSGIARCLKKVNITERLTVPQQEGSIREVLSFTAKVADSNYKIISNKVILKGEVQLLCVYVNTINDKIETITSNIPFTEIFDVDGIIQEDICSIKLNVSECEFDCEEDSNGEIRNIVTKTEIDVNISVCREVSISAIGDCYGVKNAIIPKIARIKLPQKITDIDLQETLKIQVNLSDNEPELKTVYDCFSKIYIEKTEVKNEKYIVSGTVDSYLLYITEDETDPVYCTKKETEFSESFDCGGNYDIDGEVSGRILSTSYVISESGNVDLRINMSLTGMIYKELETTVIGDVELSDVTEPKNIASVTVYFVQENDTLWDIAKRYFTTVEAIEAVNGNIENEINKGMHLIIPRQNL